MRIVIAISSALLTLVAAEAAWAHAFLDHAEPRVGSSVAAAPRQLSLWFTQNLEPAFSTVEVQNSAGGRVDVGKPRIGANVMRVGLKTLATRHLQGSVARAVGRHSYDRRQLQLPR
jgi:copper resistance protein C